MRATEFISEAKVPSVRDQIIADVKKNGPGEYFVRFTAVDKLGYSNRQLFARSPDVDDPNFSPDYIGTGKGRRALWFYPLDYYLKNRDPYASESPYVFLVKLRPNAWLQPAGNKTKQIAPAPAGKERIGILRKSSITPAAIFFKPAFDVVGKYYDYAGQHKRHGEVKGAPKPSFFDRVRGVAENFDDGKKPGRKGLAKRVGVNCKQSVSKLRDIAAHSSGERQRMAHWCANMKSGRNK